MVDRPRVGRTNLIILLLGAGACVALFFAMRQVMGLQSAVAEHPVARAIQADYGGRLATRPIFAVEHEDGTGRAVLTIEPKLSAAGPRLASTLGRQAWLEAGDQDDWDALSVIVLGRDGTHIFDVPRPTELRPARRRSKIKRQ